MEKKSASKLEEYFQTAVEKNASDLHLVAGSFPAVRVAGDLIHIGDSPLSGQDLEKMVNALVDDKIKARLISKKDVDFSKDFFGFRFRINLHFQENNLGLTARIILPVPPPEELGFDENIYRLTHLKDGLIIITGPSGCGKSTTLAAMINIINRERRAHIITIEDPIEYTFKEEQCIIEQRLVGYDTRSFAHGLKYALRQDPNVIMAGEMRDLETAQAALTAAETGHLVMSTLHTASAADAISRLVNLFPAHQKEQVQNQISLVLRACVAQQLLPAKGGGMIAARELLINTRAVANLIRRGQYEQIPSIIQTSQKEGMVAMNKAIDKLWQAGEITEKVAENRKRDLETAAVYY